MRRVCLILKFDKIIRIILFFIFFSISFLSLLAPIIQHYKGYPHGESIYKLFQPICHQYPTRSLWIFHRPFALCSRCFSGYIGVSLGFLLIPKIRKYLFRFLFGLLLLIPGVLDGYIQLISNYESTNLLRVITGLIGGIGVSFLIYPLTYKKEELL